MTGRQWTLLVAAGLLLAAGIAAATGATVPLLGVVALAVTALAVTTPAQPGTFHRRSTLIAVPGAAHAPSTAGAGDGLHPGSAR